MSHQIETAKDHIINLILANTDSSVLLKLTESYKTLVDAGFTCPVTSQVLQECGESGDCNSPEKPYIAGDWEGQQQDWDQLEKTEPAPFTSEPKKRKPRASKVDSAPETVKATEVEPPLEPQAPTTNYAVDLEEAKEMFISKIRAASAQSDEIGKVTRTKCVDLCGEYGATRVSEIPAVQLREFITLLEKI